MLKEQCTQKASYCWSRRQEDKDISSRGTKTSVTIVGRNGSGLDVQWDVKVTDSPKEWPTQGFDSTPVPENIANPQSNEQINGIDNIKSPAGVQRHKTSPAVKCW